ncbi:MAG TPA: two-component regulator propeller domain-containing protein [Bacteroidales bacterium]|nr:two-component regulator propeller domain-containing protein [Bacteroidales bacterium]
MARGLIFLLPALLLTCILKGQLPVGSWSDHFRYNTALSVAAGNDEIYASTGSAILVFNKKYNELKKLSKVNGLSGTGISSIAWSAETGTLLAAYKNTDLDLVTKNSIFNIPDIRKKYIPEKKRINRIRAYGKYFYLATGFGIVVVDPIRKEIRDTWNPGSGEVFDIAISGNSIFAATEEGLWSADLSTQGLSWPGNWAPVSGLPGPYSKCTLVIFAGTGLYCNVAGATGDVIYVIRGSTEVFSSAEGRINHSFDTAPGGFIVSSGKSIDFYQDNGTLVRSITTYGWGDPSPSQCIAGGDDLWIADTGYGLVRCRNLNEFSNLTLTGPASDNVAGIVSQNGIIAVSAGGADKSYNSLFRPLEISIFSDNRFTNISSQAGHDAMRVCFDKADPDHFFVSTWGDGLYEYRNYKLVRHFDETNSPLVPGPGPDDGIRISGLAMDNNRNLSIAQSGQRAGISILRPDGSWIVNAFTINTPLAGDIISTGAGQKWMILPAGSSLFVADDNNTPDVFSDDKSKQVIIRDNEGNIINNAFSVAEDMDGNIWVGTDRGPVIYPSGRSVFDDNAKGFRIKVPRNDGSGLADYLLGTETITSISVDGANRKWLGTLSSGIYLLSADGSEIIKNYNERNSPLPSDTISAVAVDNLTGEVWAGTSKGIVSVRELATSGSNNYTKVYAFPNPVREDYRGKLTITGLIAETRVKITDVSGNLVNETISEGGQAEWDLTTFNGERVSTGVYIIFCASADGSASAVTKILVVGN